jgi:hypothetical protein
MVDLWVAITWLAISAASVVGLSAYARVTATGLGESERATFTFMDQLTLEDIYTVRSHPMLPPIAVDGLFSAAAGDVGAASL